MRQRLCKKCFRRIELKLAPFNLIICKECGTVHEERVDGGLDRAPADLAALPMVRLMVMFLPQIRAHV